MCLVKPDGDLPDFTVTVYLLTPSRYRNDGGKSVPIMKRCLAIFKLGILYFQVLESCMKNCGSLVHDEVATKEFMEFLKNLVNVRNMHNIVQNELK